MARVVKAHGVRRDELLDAAQALMVEKGYARMTVQDVLDHCGIAKGTFYHYFDSKDALLAAVIERVHDAIEAELDAHVQAPHGGAVELIGALFARITAWKQARSPLLLALVASLQSSANALALRNARLRFDIRMRPHLVRIIARGRQEGLQPVGNDEDTADVLLSVWSAATLAGATMMHALSGQDAATIAARLRERIAAYERATERLLGATAGSVRMIDDANVAFWAERLQQPEGVAPR